MMTLEDGFSSTCRLPRFSALNIFLSASFSTLILTIAPPFLPHRTRTWFSFLLLLFSSPWKNDNKAIFTHKKKKKEKKNRKSAATGFQQGAQGKRTRSSPQKVQKRRSNPSCNSGEKEKKRDCREHRPLGFEDDGYPNLKLARIWIRFGTGPV